MTAAESTENTGPDAENSARRQHTYARYWRIAGWLVAVAALLLVFAAYRRPDMMMQMAQQMWSCF